MSPVQRGRRFGGYAIFGALLAVTGCAHFTTDGGAHRDRGTTTLVLGETTEPASLNPLLLEGTVSAMIGGLVYSYLVTYDAAGELVPDAATAVPTVANGGISRDGLRVTYHLRRGIRWQDGEPLTANDCAFTFAAIMNPRNNVPDRHGYDQIARVTAPDDATVVVELKRPYSPIAQTFLAIESNYPILPAHLMAGLRDLNELDTHRYTVGSGPFRLVDWERGDHLTFAANDGYFRGKPGVPRLVIRIVPSSTTLVNELQTHELDAALSLTDPTLLRYLRAIPGIHVTTTPAFGLTLLYFNVQTGATADRRVRQALTTAVDADLAVRRATQGVYDSKDALRGLFGNDATSSRSSTYDPTRARALLDAAGWKAGRDGVRRKNGARLSLVLIFSTAQPMFTVLATELQEQLRSVGVDVALHGYAPTQFIAPASEGGPVFGGRFDLLLTNIYSPVGPDAGSFFICSERAPLGFNLSRMCDPQLDAIVSGALHHYGPARSVDDVAAIERRLVADRPVLWLARVSFISAYAVRSRGFSPTPVTPYAGVWKWTIPSAGSKK